MIVKGQTFYPLSVTDLLNTLYSILSSSHRCTEFIKIHYPLLPSDHLKLNTSRQRTKVTAIPWKQTTIFNHCPHNASFPKNATVSIIYAFFLLINILTHESSSFVLLSAIFAQSLSSSSTNLNFLNAT